MTNSRVASPARSNTSARWQLRVLNGPESGTTYAVGTQLVIGRGADSDLQLAEQEVSRHHARIERDDAERHVLFDLGSSNGTYVDGELIRRRVLEPHAEITIADIELVYEPVPSAPATSPAPGAPLLPAQPMVRARRHAPTTPVGMAVPAGAIRDRNGHALVFEHPEGGTYDGNLLADIVEFRTLHTQRLRAGLQDPAQSDAFERLKVRLKPSPSREGHQMQRTFLRFGCWLRARVLMPDGGTLPCHVRDVGVDGSQLAMQGPEVAVGTKVRLAVEVVEAGARRSIVMHGRVMRIDGQLMGLAFSDTPRHEDSQHPPEHVHRSFPADDDEPTQLMRRPPLKQQASG